MIPASPHFSQNSVSTACNRPVRWQQLWREAIVDPHELLRVLGLESQASSLLASADTGFPMRVPRGFVARMRREDPTDPLLLQVLPGAAELIEKAGFSKDPVADLNALAAHGVLHKYAGRALLIATGSCAINCRYCFRRHFPYAEETAASNHWQSAIAHLESDASISEVILSGGDPLSLSTPKLCELSDALVRIPHIKRLRIHSRLPIVLPERVDTEFLAWLESIPLQKIVVVHSNHANEIEESVAQACADLRRAGATMLNQSVLLKGVNDSADALAALSEKLISCSVLPYYLNQLDRVTGAAHFEVDDTTAHALIAKLRDSVPGYLVPRLMRDVPGTASKTPV
jgi:EF-P beta-lysylation protein EpmB